MRLLWLGIFLASAPLARAEFCESLKDLEAKVRHCEDNGVYQEAAVRCVRRFEAEIEMAGKLLGLALLPKEKNSQQAASFALASGKFAEAQKVIDLLLAIGNAGLKDLSVYEKNVVFPEDTDSPEAVGDDLNRFLLGSDCYRETYEVLFTVRDDFGEKIAQLRAARQELLGKQGQSSGRGAGVGGLNRGASGTDRQAPAAVRPGKKKRASDISGTEEAKP